MAGPQCCENAPSLSSSCGAGHVEEFGGLKSYITGSADSRTAVLLAADGFVPDFYFGDPFAFEKTTVDGWMKNHGPDQGFEHAKPVIEALKRKGFIKVGAAGFCWGAKVVVELAKYAYIQAAVLLHPSFVSLDDIQGVKVPISILGAEMDQKLPPELLKKYEEALNAKPEVDSFVKIFPGVKHGWSVRYKDEDEREVKCAKEAHQDMLDWFAKYLK